jgi:VCBS repeat-containing protein
VAPVDVGDGGTLTASSHGVFYVSGSALHRRKVRLRHASNQASTVTVTVEDGLAQQIEFTVAADQTGQVTIQRQTTATINGGTAVQMAGPGASGVIIPGPSNVYNIEGETKDAATVGDLTVTGTLTVSGSSGAAFGDKPLVSPELRDYAETLATPASSGGSITLNYAAGPLQQITLTESITTVNFTNVPAAGKVGSLTLLVIQGAGSYTITWPGSFNWGDAGAPALPTANGFWTMISLLTVDGGTYWAAMSGWKGR